VPASKVRYPASGLDILVVGAGLGGLTFAIEAYRKDHDVRIFEKRPIRSDFKSDYESCEVRGLELLRINSTSMIN
jgi:2-polyprenyl-6-methoxyphenol hydroxylase-like FAD-dependent oxidoreductase